jgi:hypothetical protein
MKGKTMQQAISKLNDVENELNEAACRMPQDMPWQRVQNALVAVRSAREELEAAEVPIAPVADPVADTVIDEGGING